MQKILCSILVRSASKSGGRSCDVQSKLTGKNLCKSRENTEGQEKRTLNGTPASGYLVTLEHRILSYFLIVHQFARQDLEFFSILYREHHVISAITYSSEITCSSARR